MQSEYTSIEILRHIQSENVDDRKRRMTLRDLLTMTAGLEWHEDDVP
jgi:CubicO group peptidase (beta-lactamase class C family)